MNKQLELDLGSDVDNLAAEMTEQEIQNEASNHFLSSQIDDLIREKGIGAFFDVMSDNTLDLVIDYMLETCDGNWENSAR